MLRLKAGARAFPAQTLAVAASLAAFFATGCGDDWPPVAIARSLVLTPVADTLELKPGGTGPASFRLTTKEGAPAARERLELSAIDDPAQSENKVAGATLAASSAVTDQNGIGRVTVTAGLPTKFLLVARNPRAQTATMEVVVKNVGVGGQATIAVLPTLTPGSSGAAAVTSIDVLLFDSFRCAELLALPALPNPLRSMTVEPFGTAELNVSDRVKSSAVIGQGRDATGHLRTTGCVDVPSSALIWDSVVQVVLPLSEIELKLPPSFVLASRFSLARRDITQRLSGPWKDLSDCPLDPGQLWLDCAIDALDSAPGDTLDCVPSLTGQGELASLITGRRGVAVPGSACRSSTRVGGVLPSLEAQIALLFPSPAQSPANQLAAQGQALATILDDVRVGSWLSLDATASPGLFEATHDLRNATFLVAGTSAVVDIVAQGSLATRARFVSVTTDAGSLTVESHKLGLHLGSLAHAAFSNVALVRRGLPGATPAYLNVLFGLASMGTGMARKTGCDALDLLVCTAVGRPVGCLHDACVAGQAALATRLDAAFAELDGDGADLQLSGLAGMTDDDGDGEIDRLGVVPDESGLWTAQIRARAATEILSGSWTGAKMVP